MGFFQPKLKFFLTKFLQKHPSMGAGDFSYQKGLKILTSLVY